MQAKEHRQGLSKEHAESVQTAECWTPASAFADVVSFVHRKCRMTTTVIEGPITAVLYSLNGVFINIKSVFGSSTSVV